MRKHTIIILGGNSPQNKYWIQMMNKNLKLDFSTQTFFYSHREENLPDINFEKEIIRLSQFINQKRISNYSIVAKSAGFVLSLLGTTKNILQPRTIVGYGLPVEYSNYRKINLKSLIITTSKKTNIICVQADKDPQGDLQVVKAINAGLIPVWDIKGSTHNYDNFMSMASIAKAFISTHQPLSEHKIEK